MSQRVTTKTGRRKKKVKSSSSSSTAAVELIEVEATIPETETTSSSSTTTTNDTDTLDVIDDKIEIELLKNDNSTLINNDDDDDNSKKKTKELNIIEVPDIIIGIPDSFFLIDEPKYLDIDGTQVRSAIFSSTKWPVKVVTFPDNDNNIVTGYHEPANPWRHGESKYKQKKM